MSLPKSGSEAITAIKQARSAPVQECLAHGECFGGKCIYTAPPAQRQWVGLTDKDISDTATTHPMTWVNLNAVENRTLFARILEAKLKEKNA